MINSRAETVAENPAYRAAFKSRRCAVPMRGYYEWRAEAGGKQPFYFTSAEGGLLWIAGLWEQRGGLRMFAVVTTDANDFTGQVHNRMPVVLDRTEVPTWIGEQPATTDGASHAYAAVRPVQADGVAGEPGVNRPQSQGVRLTEPMGCLC